MKCRFIEVVGERSSLHLTWGEDCPNSHGWGSVGAHSVQKHLADGPKDGATDPAGSLEEWQGKPESWPNACAHCGRPVPKEHPERVECSLGRRRLYSNTSGSPEPGDMYFAPWYHGEHKPHNCPWDNCDDPRGHLIVVLPNGHPWDVDSRASNCDMKDDRTHRCWVRHGEPPNLHVDKAGHTCNAGAGSIANGNYHGFLHNGELTDC